MQLPMTEYIAHVDESDNEIGKTTREEIHISGYPHRVVSVFLTQGEHLLVNKRRDNNLLDHSVGGHVRMGESYLEAAIREAKEEVGLEINAKNLTLVEHFFVDESHRTKSVRHWFTLFVAQVPETFIPKPQEEEVVSLTFFRIADVIQAMKKNPKEFCYGFLATMNAFLKKYDPSHEVIQME